MTNNKITRFQPSPKATVCHKNNCFTVYGQAAELIQAIAIVTTLVISVSLVAKALK